MLVPRPVGWGGGNSRILAVRHETRSSGRCRGSRIMPVDPPPNVAENNNNMTIRRIYNKAIYFLEMSVLFETGELNTYAYDSDGLYRRKYV